MNQRGPVFLLFILVVSVSALSAQQYNSVPLDHAAYQIIEMGVLKGIITRPPSSKPWSEFTIKDYLREMLTASGKGTLSQKEIEIVSAALASFNRKNGLDLQEGRYRTENKLLKQRFSFESGLNWESDLSIKLLNPTIGTVNTGKVYLAGDMGEYFSWDFNIRAGFFSVEREYLGLREDAPYVDTKYGPYDGNPNSNGHYYYYDIPLQSWSNVYSLPAYFPYTFSRRWEGGVFAPEKLGSYGEWPDKFSFGYEMFGELNTSLFDNRLLLRFGRMRRDWGPESNGASLYMNAMARPFIAVEGSVSPLNWMHLSFLTGVLEYLNTGGNQWQSADPFQNVLSLLLLEFDPGKHFHFGLGSSTVWPKRFELGYIFPISSNFFYQNNVGDFDNLALFMDLEYRLPGIFKIWGSLYVDEIRPDAGLSRFFTLDRNMYAYQGGVTANIPRLPFTTVTLRYSKVEPYNYTHEYTETPWNRVPVDTSYLNNGESLGFYLPPNSDELLLRLDSMFLPQVNAHIQYQLIRHGAEWGYGRVDGSSLYDKIVKDDYTEKHFLRDGAYQWDHVIKLGGSYSLKSRNIPLAFFAETGVVITRFTITDHPGTEQDEDFKAIDNAEYPAGTRFIFSVGFKIYP